MKPTSNYPENRTAWDKNSVVGDSGEIFPLKVMDGIDTKLFVALAKLKGQIMAMIQGTKYRGI